MEHTKTPWHVGKKSPRFIYASDGLYIIAQCDSMDEMTREQETANAAHIVRAVNAHADLISALEKSVQHMEQLASTVNTLSNKLGLGDKVRASDFTEHAKAALALVKGKS